MPRRASLRFGTTPRPGLGTRDKSFKGFVPFVPMGPWDKFGICPVLSNLPHENPSRQGPELSAVQGEHPAFHQGANGPSDDLFCRRRRRRREPPGSELDKGFKVHDAHPARIRKPGSARIWLAVVEDELAERIIDGVLNL